MDKKNVMTVTVGRIMKKAMTLIKILEKGGFQTIGFRILLSKSIFYMI